MSEPVTPPDSTVPGRVEPAANWRQVLHQLNNVFASIHSSLDLVLTRDLQPEVKAFLLDAQSSVRRGALLINALRESHSGPAELELGGPLKGPNAPEKSSNPPAEPATLEGSERILVAEDEEPLRLVIRALLGYRGYRVTEAKDGREAVEQFRQKGPFDLVILDTQMPNVNGPQALQDIRKLDPHVPALALSGMDFGPEASSGVSKREFNGYLTKPWDNATLLKTVRQLLDGRNRRAAGGTGASSGD